MSAPWPLEQLELDQSGRVTPERRALINRRVQLHLSVYDRDREFQVVCGAVGGGVGVDGVSGDGVRGDGVSVQGASGDGVDIHGVRVHEVGVDRVSGGGVSGDIL